MKTMQEIINKNRVTLCLTCGKCSSVCPITRWESREYISPRLLVEKALYGEDDQIFNDLLFWSCTTCGHCTELCPSDVDFCGFIRDMRKLARKENLTGACTHGDAIQTWARIMTDPELKQNRIGWVNDDLKISDQSDTIYFTGCLPYYDIMFRDLGAESTQIAQSAIKILNKTGIEPCVMPNERCCGHDQIWEGDEKTFKALAELNIEQFKSIGAKRIITTCPECAYTLKYDYPKFIGDYGMEIMHITEYMADQVSKGTIDFVNDREEKTVTYQDPCRLGRNMGVYDAPRIVLRKLGYHTVEMKKNRSAGLCCGTSCWTSCGKTNKKIQTERLGNATETGAELLVTACIKCQVHFKCAQKDKMLEDKIGIKIHDLTILAAERLKS